MNEHATQICSVEKTSELCDMRNLSIHICPLTVCYIFQFLFSSDLFWIFNQHLFWAIFVVLECIFFVKKKCMDHQQQPEFVSILRSEPEYKFRFFRQKFHISQSREQEFIALLVFFNATTFQTNRIISTSWNNISLSKKYVKD